MARPFLIPFLATRHRGHNHSRLMVEVRCPRGTRVYIEPRETEAGWRQFIVVETSRPYHLSQITNDEVAHLGITCRRLEAGKREIAGLKRRGFLPILEALAAQGVLSLTRHEGGEIQESVWDRTLNTMYATKRGA